MYVTNHALDRFRQHKWNADWGDALNSISEGCEIDKNLVAEVTHSSRRRTHEGKFVLSKTPQPLRSGTAPRVEWGIWVIDEVGMVRTYLRLGDTQKKVLDLDSFKEEMGSSLMEIIPRDAEPVQARKGFVEFILQGHLVTLSARKEAGVMSWVVRKDMHSPAVASGKGPKDLALKTALFTLRELEVLRRCG